MIAKTMFGLCVLSLAWTTGCSSSDTAAAPDPVCPTGPGTTEFTLADVSPARGASVPNQNIVQTFTVKNAPAAVASFSFAMLPTHTAGARLPASTSFRYLPVGSDIVYSLTVDSWTIAPGHVETAISSRYKTDDGCIWAFPSPLFSYDVVPGAGGDGGTPGDAGSD